MISVVPRDLNSILPWLPGESYLCVHTEIPLQSNVFNKENHILGGGGEVNRLTGQGAVLPGPQIPHP